MTALRTGQVLLMLAGLIAWALQFTLIYGATSTLCGREWAECEASRAGRRPGEHPDRDPRGARRHWGRVRMVASGIPDGRRHRGPPPRTDS